MKQSLLGLNDVNELPTHNRHALNMNTDLHDKMTFQAPCLEGQCVRAIIQ